MSIFSQLFFLLRRVVSLFLLGFDRLTGRRPTGIMAFCYHSLGADRWRFSVNLPLFRKEMEYLLKKYSPVNPRQLSQALLGGQKSFFTQPGFIICFDDGYRDILVSVGFLKERGVCPIVFPLADPTRVNRCQLGTDKELLASKELNYLFSQGWEIGCHSATHADFSQLNDFELKKETLGAREKMMKEVEAGGYLFAYPKGWSSQKVTKKVAEAGFILAFGMGSGYIDQESDRFNLPRIGVDGSHSFSEFKALSSPSVVKLRGFILSAQERFGNLHGLRLLGFNSQFFCINEK